MAAGRRAGYDAVEDIEAVADDADFDQATELATTTDLVVGGGGNESDTDDNNLPIEQRANQASEKPQSWRQRHKLIWDGCFWSVVILVYGLLGGLLFNLCEFHHERHQILNKKDWLREMNATLLFKSNQTIGENLHFLHDYAQGLIDLNSIPDKLSDNRWNMEASAFFAFTTASTIGYGYTAPVTKAGKALVFFYGLPGIAIYAMAFFALGKVILDASNIIIQYLVRHLDKMEEKIAQGVLQTETECDDRIYEICCFWFPRKLDPSVRSDGGLRDKKKLIDDEIVKKSDEIVVCCSCIQLRLITVTNIQRTIIGVAVIITLVLAGAGSLHQSQGWGYGNCVYYMFVSVSTIGYGDFQPDSSVGEAPAFPLLMIFLGLCVLAALISQWQDRVQDDLADILNRGDTVISRLKSTIRDSLDTEEENVASIKPGGTLASFVDDNEE